MTRKERHKRRMQVVGYMRGGRTIDEVSKLTGYTSSYIRMICGQYKVPINKNQRSRANVYPHSRVLEVAVRLLKAEPEEPMTEIAEELGVSRQYVHQIKEKLSMLGAFETEEEK